MWWDSRYLFWRRRLSPVLLSWFLLNDTTTSLTGIAFRIIRIWLSRVVMGLRWRDDFETRRLKMQKVWFWIYKRWSVFPKWVFFGEADVCFFVREWLTSFFFQMEADECLRWSSSDFGRECRWFSCARFLVSSFFFYSRCTIRVLGPVFFFCWGKYTSIDADTFLL